MTNTDDNELTTTTFTLSSTEPFAAEALDQALQNEMTRLRSSNDLASRSGARALAEMLDQLGRQLRG